MTTAELTQSECLTCVNAAIARMIGGEIQGLNHAKTYRGTFMERLGREIIGVAAEMTVAKYLQIFWTPPINTFHTLRDVADIEVRSTLRDNGCLIIRPRELDDEPKLLDTWHVLVTGEPPTMTIRGAILGREAKHDEWLRDPHDLNKAAWFVPQHALTPFTSTMADIWDLF